MGDGYKKSFEQVLKFWADLPKSKKWLLSGVAGVSLLGFLAIIIFASQDTYKILSSGLEPAEAARITEILKVKNIPYKLLGTGNIAVPINKLEQARLDIASTGIMPKGVGMELFDQMKFGTPSYIQEINMTRALEGELARTIAFYPEVELCRVHLVIPKKRVFQGNSDEPQASVLVKLKTGAFLSKAQITGIRYLVASAVASLKPAKISIIDNNGGMIASPLEDGTTGSETALGYKSSYEEDVRKKIIDLLEDSIGRDSIKVQVNADLDFARVIQTEETFDPDTVAPRSEEHTNETRMDKSSGNPSGQVPANALSVPPSSSDGKSNAYSKTDKIINYEVSRFTKQTESPVARLRRLSVAVMVDSRYEVDPKSKTKEKIPVLRNEKEMEVLTGLVKRAMGFDEKRDDQISVNCIPFAREDMSEMAKTPLLDRPITSQAIRYGVIFGLGFLLIFGFLRPVARAVLFPAPPDALNEAPELPMIQAGGQTVASLEQQLFSPADMANEQLEASKTDLMRSTFEPSSPVNDLKKQLIACYNSDFDRTVSVLREWLKEDDDLTSRRTSLEEE